MPSSPIRLRDQLRGRERAFDRTQEALSIPGRSAFIYGERGVGKSSLALTAALQFNSSDAEPIRVVCHPTITFGQLVGQIAKRMRDQLGMREGVKKVTEIGLKLSLVTVMQRIESESEKAPLTIDVNDAVELLDALLPKNPSAKRVIIIDELDAVDDPVFRSNIAYFIKQLGDNQARLKFIFAGIAGNVSELLVHHESAQRCMATIQLERLGLNILRDIIVEGFRQIGMTIKETTANRIACLSDGFPHFTHLIGLKMALAALNAETIPESVDDVSFLEDAIGEAVNDSEAIVKEAYEKAIQKYGSYEAVLWAVADHWELLRSTRDIYQSYVRVCADLAKRGTRIDVVDTAKLSKLLYNLKQAPHGQALVSVRKSWYKIRVTMLRGYCRMVAASKGVDVGLDYLQVERTRVPAATSSTPRLEDAPEDPADEPYTEEPDAEIT